MEPITYNADALKLWQGRYLKNNDTFRDSISFSIRSAVAVQRDDGGLWMYGVIVEGKSTDHNG